MPDIRIALLVSAHCVLCGAAVWLIAASSAPLWLRIPGGLFAAAVLLPWLPSLAALPLARAPWLALLLVLVIGAGIVEVFATGAAWPASILFGSAMLEFALLISLVRAGRAPAPSESAQP
jgi:hypothetical protein